ncbi:FAD binding domain-containing protein [Thermomicrobium roseum]|jgi:carbon-monoxide dehydrogenase medium subunit|uniref:Carbon monoxide dehydrogenase medium chain n=1 Tax=Thermomicrobium roseum (strain ATCC 27502 / DSM 5159 / P-2) TaxID=309801 RepID=B9L1E9_THERP|nr:xanthine dehydrogenase family protein subunit M [Thermomicrobium roseum]ACM05996.1 carbon monoxide dehydrogenase medium chain [Thermomicrobium roseum DSM 5159]
MYPSTFTYYRAGSVQEALKLLLENPDAKLLAGGHSLIPAMKLRLASPSALIDISRISELAGIRDTGDRIVIGATTRYDDIQRSDLVRRVLPILPEAIDVIGDLQVRNMGTIGGSLAHADPAADLPAVVIALGAEIKAVGPDGERTIPADQFFIDLFTTALQANEILTEIAFPKPPARTGMSYQKFANPASGYAVVGAAAVVTLAEDGTVAAARVGVTGAGPYAVRRQNVEQALVGKQPTAETIEAASQLASEGMTFNSDIFASEEYRAHLTRVFVKRALTRAVERARG